jgi:hypothetical protein
MADGWDITDIVFQAVESAATGFVLWKDNTANGEKNNHITVNLTGVSSQDYVNKAPAVNVNVFVKRNSNGTVNRQLMKTTVRAVEDAIKEIAAPEGMYWHSRIEWTEPLGEAKEGFDCTNIRIVVVTELN